MSTDCSPGYQGSFRAWNEENWHEFPGSACHKTIWFLPRLVRVRDEDLDWEIYHRLPTGGTLTVEDLVRAGYYPSTVEASLARLEEAGLIERRGETVRALSFQEAILLCKLRNDRESPFCIENGIIRVKTAEERKE